MGSSTDLCRIGGSAVPLPVLLLAFSDRAGNAFQNGWTSLGPVVVRELLPENRTCCENGSFFFTLFLPYIPLISAFRPTDAAAKILP